MFYPIAFIAAALSIVIFGHLKYDMLVQSVVLVLCFTVYGGYGLALLNLHALSKDKVYTKTINMFEVFTCTMISLFCGVLASIFIFMFHFSVVVVKRDTSGYYTLIIVSFFFGTLLSMVVDFYLSEKAKMNKDRWTPLEEVA